MELYIFEKKVSARVHIIPVHVDYIIHTHDKTYEQQQKTPKSSETKGSPACALISGNCFTTTKLPACQESVCR